MLHIGHETGMYDTAIKKDYSEKHASKTKIIERDVFTATTVKASIGCCAACPGIHIILVYCKLIPSLMQWFMTTEPFSYEP